MCSLVSNGFVEPTEPVKVLSLSDPVQRGHLTIKVNDIKARSELPTCIMHLESLETDRQ